MKREEWEDYYKHSRASRDFVEHFARRYGWDALVQPYKDLKLKSTRRARSTFVQCAEKLPFVGSNSGNTSYYFCQFVDAMHGKLRSIRREIKVDRENGMGVAKMAERSKDNMQLAIMRFSNYSLDPVVSCETVGPFPRSETGPTIGVIKVRASHFERLRRLGFDTSFVQSGAGNLCIDSKLIVDIYNVRNINRDKPLPEDAEYKLANVVVIERYRPSGEGYKYRWATGFIAHHDGFSINRFSAVSEQAALIACKMSVRKKIDATILGQ